MKTKDKHDGDDGRNQELAPIFAAAVNRTDQWRELHALSRGWATAQGAQAEDLRAGAAKLLQVITRLEQCWAYPGPRLLTAIGEAIAQRDAATFARLVQKVSGALLSGDYRRGEAAWDPATQSATRPLEAALPPDVDPGEAPRPAFEVLIVTPADPAGWERGRADMKRLRRTDDAFQYEVVQAGSFEDAALAVLGQ